jgi:hypothetical protein
MKISRALVFRWFFLGSLVLCGFVFSTVRVVAQTGDKAVWTINGQNPTLAPSTAWVDASAFCANNGTNGCKTKDFCSMMFQGINQLISVSSSGGVVDTRGVLQIPAQQEGNFQCKSNPFPLLQNNSIPITVLLPAYTIELTAYNGTGSGTWTLPNNVRLVGAGYETILLGASDCCSGAMIEMGPPNSCQSPLYTGIAIEHIQLYTQGTGYGGIDNECAGTGSYVNDVQVSGFPNTPTNLGGTALTIGSGAIGSGPYTDISVIAAPGGPHGTNCGSGAPALSCVVLGAQTRGLHGLTCLGSETTAGQGGVGIKVNASNNSIEDVHLESFFDGIEIGDTTASPVSNIFVSNIETGSTGTCSPSNTTTAVHICGPTSANTTNYPVCLNHGNSGSVTDVAMLGISNDTNEPVNSIQDDQTETIIDGCASTDCASPITSGMYILGRPDGGSTPGYSMFAINPASKSNFNNYGPYATIVPTWGIGSTGGLTNTTCYTPGALYSNTSSGGGIYVCTFTSGGTWQPAP